MDHTTGATVGNGTFLTLIRLLVCSRLGKLL
jgi:hypothetical protein